MEYKVNLDYMVIFVLFYWWWIDEVKEILDERYFLDEHEDVIGDIFKMQF